MTKAVHEIKVVVDAEDAQAATDLMVELGNHLRGKGTKVYSMECRFHHLLVELPPGPDVVRR